jgi:hypothetical protein
LAQGKKILPTCAKALMPNDRRTKSERKRSFVFLSVLWLLIFQTACSFLPAPSAPVSAHRLKIFIASPGLYRVPLSVLRDNGADTTQLDRSTLQLYRGDQPVAIRVNEGDQPSFDFFAQASDSPYTPFNVYWLRWGVEPGKRMHDASTPAPSGAPKESAEFTLTTAKPTLYLPQISNPGSQWFWQSLTSPATSTLTITLPSALGNPAHLRATVWASTEDPQANPDHHLVLTLNNTRVVDEKWDGQGNKKIDVAVPAGLLRAGENILRISAPGDTKALAEVNLLQSVEAAYTRRLSAENDALDFQTDPGTYRVSGFSSDALELFDITNPLDPVRISNLAINSSALTFASDARHRWLAITPGAIKTPARIAPMSANNLRAPERKADYILITHPDFLDAVQPLVKHRRARGLSVTVVTAQEVYDEFGFGLETPFAIRDYLNWARANGSPRFVLLVGKASYDYLNYLNAPNKNLLPTFLVATPHLGQAASDNWFVADEKTGKPALAIGRIPAKTPEQVSRVVSKIIAYETAGNADWRGRALFIADDKEELFGQQADTLVEKAAPKTNANKVYLAAFKGDVNKTRAEILSRWNEGLGWLTYVGHGSIGTWAEGPLLSADYFNQIKNGDRLPILFTPTCLDGYFYHPLADSLAEELLFKNDGGIIAGLVPTGLSLPFDQEEMMRGLFDELFQNSTPTLGEAIMKAKQKMSGDTPENREVIDTFGLLGDPALAVRVGR